MSFLLDDLLAALEEDEGLAPTDVEDLDFEAELVSDEYVDSSRWSEHWTAVFRRGDEYVALGYEVPATEMQEGGDFYSEVYEVKPVQVTRWIYEKV